MQGEGPHNFALTVTADGSEQWAPRATTITVDLSGAYSTTSMKPTSFDSDGDGAMEMASDNGPMYTVVVGLSLIHISEPTRPY